MKDFYNKLSRLKLNSQLFLFVFIFVLFSYSYQSVLPAYNSDDIIQLQEISNDSYTFLGSGRWGYFFVFKYLLEAGSGGLFATFFGCLFLLGSSVYSYKVIGLKTDLAKVLFILAATISVYYGFLFAFDSTRFAYPIAIFLVVFGFYQLLKSQYVLSVVLIAFSLSFYQSSIQIVATVFLLSVMYRLINNEKGIWRYFLVGSAVLAISMISYLLFTKVLYYFMGFSLTDRVSVDLMAFVSNYSVLVKTVYYFVFPVSYVNGSYYIDWKIVYPLFAIIVGFIFSFIFSKSTNKWAVLLVFILSLFSPFFLAFVSTEPSFPPRSLIAIASLHAAWLAISIDIWLTKKITADAGHRLMVIGLTVVGLVFVSMHSMQINKIALDDHLVSQEDLFATNRIISRIEQVASQQIIANPSQKMTLAVIYDQALPAGARGDVGTARSAQWSKEWIFRLIDNRYMVADRQTKAIAAEKARSVAVWPAPDSVFLLDDGVVVVKIN